MILLTLAALAIAAPEDANPLAPGRDGRVQCYDPDIARKTCRAIGAYAWSDDGAITNHASAMLNADPLVIMHASSPVYVRDGAECSAIAPMEDQITAIEVDGAPLTGEAFDGARQRVAAAMTQVFGASGEYCSTYHPKPDGTMRALVTVDGVPRPEADATLMWVRVSDGWRVAP